jgi:tetrahydromethanopterin S-methyltransferase subunit F
MDPQAYVREIVLDYAQLVGREAHLYHGVVLQPCACGMCCAALQLEIGGPG